MNDYWCIPPKESAEFVANMEDILDIYEMPYNPELPVVCMDEKPYQCLGNSREPLPMRRGITKKLILNMSEKGSAVFLFLRNPYVVGVTVAFEKHGQHLTGQKK